MCPVFPQMTRNELPDNYSNCICWLQQTWEYFYCWEWWNIYAVGVALPALALGSVVNADAESAGWSQIGSRYVPSSGSNDKKWAARHLLSLYMLTTNMSINLCLGMKKYLCRRHGIKGIGIGLNGQCRCWWSLKWLQMSCRTSALIVYIDYKHECIFMVGNDKIFTLSAWPPRHRHWVLWLMPNLKVLDGCWSALYM